MPPAWRALTAALALAVLGLQGCFGGSGSALADTTDAEDADGAGQEDASSGSDEDADDGGTAEDSADAEDAADDGGDSSSGSVQDSTGAADAADDGQDGGSGNTEDDSGEEEQDDDERDANGCKVSVGPQRRLQPGHAPLPRLLGSMTEKHYHYHLEDENGLGVHLEYDVDVEDDVQIVPLGELKDVETLHCAGPGTLEVSFASELSARAFQEQLDQVRDGKRVFLTSPRVEACPSGTFLARATASKPRARGVEIQYAEAGYEDVFRYAKVSYSTSLAGPGQVATPKASEASAPSSGDGGRRLFLWNALETVWSAAKTFAKTVQVVVNLVETVADLVDGEATVPKDGPYDKEMTFFSMDCAYGITKTSGTSSGSVTGTIETKASAELIGKLEFQLEISNYRLAKADIAVEGNLNVLVEATAQGNMEVQEEKQLTTFRAGPIPVTLVAITLQIDFEAPMHVGYEAQYTGEIKATQKIEGGLRFEYKYRPQLSDDKKHERTLTPTLTANSSVDVTSRASLTVYLKFAPTIVIWKLFSLSLPLKPYHLTILDFTKAQQDNCFLQKYVGLDAGLVFRALGIVEVSFPNVLSEQWPLLPNLEECEDSRRLSDQPRLRGLATASQVGQMWNGTISETACYSNSEPGFGSGMMQLQLVQEEGARKLFMGAVNLGQASWGAYSDRKQAGGQCAITIKLEIDPNRPRGWNKLWPPTPLDPDFFAMCGGFGFNLDTLTFELNSLDISTEIAGSSSCHLLQLARMPPIADGQLS